MCWSEVSKQTNIQNNKSRKEFGQKKQYWQCTEKLFFLRLKKLSAMTIFVT